MLLGDFFLLPPPIHISVDASKSSLYVLLHGVPMPTHNFYGIVHFCHNQRSSNALAKFSKSRNPEPPKSVDLATIGQITLHFPSRAGPTVYTPGATAQGPQFKYCI